MATQEKTWNVANRLHSLKDSDNPEVNHIIAGADEIYDDAKGAKQSDINAQTDAAIAERYTKSETYSKEQLDSLITTPDANYVTVATFADLPQTGEANTIYRVSSYDGTQVDASKYALYAWNGTSYQLLAVRSAVGEVFDVSEYNSGATYETLTAALAAVPASFQRGGMSIKFILRTNTGTEEEPVYHDEYVQYRLMSTDWSTVITDWQGVDKVPTPGSHNFVESGGVQNELALGAIYDVSAKNPTAGSNNDGKFESLSALLSDANLNTLIPTAYRKGGMSIKFVQSSDNKYVQFRCIPNEFSTDPEDWAICDEGVYIDNSDFIEVKLDKEGKMFEGTKNNGKKVFPAGIDNIEEILNDGIPNKSTIDKFSEENGKLLWNNENINNLPKTQVLHKAIINSGFENFSSHNGWSYNNGKFVNSLYGLSNRLVLKYSFGFDPRTEIIDFKPNQNAVVWFGTESRPNDYGDGNMVFCIDFEAGKLSYYGKWSLSNFPSTPMFETTFTLASYSSKTLRIALRYDKRDINAKLYDLTNNEELCSLTPNYTGGTPFVGYDKYFIYSETANISISNILVKTDSYIGECRAIIFGDSITYGQGVDNPDLAWSYKLADKLKNSFVSGLSGGTIASVLNKTKTELATQRPTYTIVCIGANGGNTRDNLKELVNIIRSYDSIPILCTTPEMHGDVGLTGTNELIVNVANEEGCGLVRMDIATCIDYDLSQGCDTSLFYDAPHTHPNAAGYLRMYNRVFIDIPELL